MAKIYDITQKLKFKEAPVLKIYDREMKINHSAENVLQYIEASREIQENPEKLRDVAHLLLSEADYDYLLKDLQLDMEDFSAVLGAAIALVQGRDPDSVAEEAEDGFRE